MTALVRPLDLFDIPSLKRYCQSILFLDSAAGLTRDNPLTAIQLLAHLNPRRRVYTAIWERGNGISLGQIACGRDDLVARLIFVAPADQAAEAVPLYEHLIARAAQWEKFYLIAEVDERSALFQTLRLSGFTTYAWQRIWMLPHDSSPPKPPFVWRALQTSLLAEAQALYVQIVPPLLQPIESPPDLGHGLICRAGALSAWARGVSGTRGVWVQPLLHPDSDCAAEQLLALGRAFGGRRPVYLCVRSYQAWLEPLLEDMGAQAGPRQAVMVKRLAISQPAQRAVPKLKRAWVKPAAS